MKSTNTVLAVAIVIAGFASFGCGSDVSSGVSIADARDECNLFQILSTGEPLPESEFNASIILAEALRDDGVLESAFILAVSGSCRANAPIGAVRNQCVVCTTAVAAAVWP